MSGKCGIEEIVAKVTSLGKITPSPGCKKPSSGQQSMLKKLIAKSYSKKTTTSCRNDCFCIMGTRKKDGPAQTETISVEASLKNSNCTYTGTAKVSFTTYTTKGTCVPKKIVGIVLTALTERDEALLELITATMQDASQQAVSAIQRDAAVQTALSRDFLLVNEDESESLSIDVDNEENVNSINE